MGSSTWIHDDISHICIFHNVWRLLCHDDRPLNPSSCWSSVLLGISHLLCDFSLCCGICMCLFKQFPSERETECTRDNSCTGTVWPAFFVIIAICRSIRNKAESGHWAFGRDLTRSDILWNKARWSQNFQTELKHLYHFVMSQEVSQVLHPRQNLHRVQLLTVVIHFQFFPLLMRQ